MSQPSEVAPGGTPKWVIAVVIIVVVVCFCVGVVGLLLSFGGPILKSLGLTSALPPLVPLA